MIKKVFRPFWSYDIIATEQWLMKMAASGYILRSVNFFCKIFVFEKSQCLNMNYRILFDKSQNRFTETLKNSGWSISAQNSKWAILENKTENIPYYPQRVNIIERANKITKISSIALGILGTYFAFTLILDLIFFTILIKDSVSVEYVPAPYPILDLVKYIVPIVNIAIILWLIIIFVKSKGSIKKLEAEYKTNGPLENIQETDASNIIKIKKTFAFFNYEKLMVWLEAQAQSGLILNSIKRNNFYFRKDIPKTIKFFIDIQKKLTPDYYEINKQAGFNLVFDSKVAYGRIIIWSKEFKENEAIEELYSDKTERLNCAKKLLINKLIFSIPFLLIGFMQIYIGLNSIFVMRMNEVMWMIPTFLWFFILVLSFFILYNSVNSYLKTKANIKKQDAS